jgi:S-adenosylmethionine hydrolase
MPTRTAMSRIITLTTDFGYSDHFVGTMKGVILTIAPKATIVDITQDIEPFNILEGAFTLAQSYPYFPKGTIHVAVVDPGVGTSRRALLVEAAAQYFIGPDNGVFSMIYSAVPHRVRAITNCRYLLASVSQTFHGRDIFSPCAAHLASGAKPATYGKIIKDYIQLGLMRPNQTSRRAWSGTVLKVDRFGNLITNFHIDQFPSLRTSSFEVSIGLRRIIDLTPTFAECIPGDPCVLIGSSGYLEVVINQASAARALGCAAGSPVELTFYS